MIARLAALIVSSGAALLLGGCTSFYEIPIETPIQPKLDISGFQRVLVAGFVAGGTDDVDANLETVRLLRSQLRTKAGLRVIEADVLPLQEIAQDQDKPASDSAPSSDTTANGGEPEVPQGLPDHIKDEKDLEGYERIFAN